MRRDDVDCRVGTFLSRGRASQLQECCVYKKTAWIPQAPDCHNRTVVGFGSLRIISIQVFHHERPLRPRLESENALSLA